MRFFLIEFFKSGEGSWYKVQRSATLHEAVDKHSSDKAYMKTEPLSDFQAGQLLHQNNILHECGVNCWQIKDESLKNYYL